MKKEQKKCSHRNQNVAYKNSFLSKKEFAASYQLISYRSLKTFFFFEAGDPQIDLREIRPELSLERTQAVDSDTRRNRERLPGGGIRTVATASLPSKTLNHLGNVFQPL